METALIGDRIVVCQGSKELVGSYTAACNLLKDSTSFQEQLISHLHCASSPAAAVFTPGIWTANRAAADRLNVARIREFKSSADVNLEVSYQHALAKLLRHSLIISSRQAKNCGSSII